MSLIFFELCFADDKMSFKETIIRGFYLVFSFKVLNFDVEETGNKTFYEFWLLRFNYGPYLNGFKVLKADF